MHEYQKINQYRLPQSMAHWCQHPPDINDDNFHLDKGDSKPTMACKLNQLPLCMTLENGSYITIVIYLIKGIAQPKHQYEGFCHAISTLTALDTMAEIHSLYEGQEVPPFSRLMTLLLI